MNPRVRLFVTALLFVFVSALASLLLLTLLNNHLEDPGLHHLDLATQTRVHSWTKPGLAEAMLALTWIGSIKIFASALALVLIAFLYWRKFHAAILLTASIIGAFILNETLKVHFHRTRPHVPWAIGDEHTFSFPSGHSLFAIALYGTLAYLALLRPTSVFRRLAILLPALLLVCGIGLSRIYLGMHYPSDVAAGFLVGSLWFTAIVAVDRAWSSSFFTSPNGRRKELNRR